VASRTSLALELPGILNWALEGLARLEQQGRFTRPRSTEQQLDEMRALASPVSAFVAERCVTGMEHEIAIDELYAAWRTWAEDNGHGKKPKQTLGRDLRAAVQGRLRIQQPRTVEGRVRHYIGLTLKGRA
jgi:putative DNA primase/helicase